MKNKKVIVGLISILIITVLFTIGIVLTDKQPDIQLKVVNVQANHTTYNSVQELIDDVDLIIIGEPLKNFTEDKAVVNYENFSGLFANPPRISVSSFHTLRTVKVHKTIKGTLSKNTLKIGEVAAVVKDVKGKVIMKISCYSIAQKGKKYLFFLKKGYTGDYFIMAANQGKFNIDGTDEKEKSSEEEEPQYSDLKKDVLKYFAKEIKEAE